MLRREVAILPRSDFGSGGAASSTYIKHARHSLSRTKVTVFGLPFPCCPPGVSFAISSTERTKTESKTKFAPAPVSPPSWSWEKAAENLIQRITGPSHCSVVREKLQRMEQNAKCCTHSGRRRPRSLLLGGFLKTWNRKQQIAWC